MSNKITYYQTRQITTNPIIFYFIILSSHHLVCQGNSAHCGISAYTKLHRADSWFWLWWRISLSFFFLGAQLVLLLLSSFGHEFIILFVDVFFVFRWHAGRCAVDSFTQTTLDNLPISYTITATVGS